MTPGELALLVLRARFGTDLARADPSPELAVFQQEAHARLLGAVQRFGGALLADSVGLGKTFVAAAVARSLARPGHPAVAVVPTALQRLWRRTLGERPGTLLVSHATLSRGGARSPPGSGLLIVDEAHAFRNPRTRRYTALARLAAGRPVLLLTATPINNSVRDLYWLLRLFADDATFAAIGVESLDSCFDQACRTGRPARIPAVLAAVAVRRSREMVTELYGEVRVGGRALRFPSRAPPRPVPYQLAGELRPLLAGGIEELELRPWEEAAGGSWLLRLLLLKRLESSAAALRVSLGRLESGLRAFVDALARGLLLLPSARGRGYFDADQLQLDALLLRPAPPSLDVPALRESAVRDLERLRAALAAVGAALAVDPKLLALRELLEGELRDRPVLLFTEYRETADYLWRALRGRFPCALVHGSGAWLGSAPAARRAVIERFAPRANGVPPPPGRERVRLLIATDVLAEGLNLQDAADLVSWDLPWNPVRLVQRLGRIDRLGSTNAQVRSWYFVPDRELEHLLGLLRRIRAKLRAIRTTIGADGPVLAGTSPAAEVRRLAAGDSAPFRRAEQAREGLFDVEERLRAALRRAEAAGGNALAGLPLSGPRRPPKGPPAVRPGSAARYAVAPDAVFACTRQEPPLALVFVARNGVQRAVFVGRRGCLEDDVASGEVLLRALNCGTGAGPGPGDGEAQARAVANRAVRWLDARAAAPPRAGATGRRLARLLLRSLQEVPAGATDEDCRRAEQLLQRLRAPLPAAAEAILRPLTHDSGSALRGLLERLESVFAGGCPPRPEPSRVGSPATVTAVFLRGCGG